MQDGDSPAVPARPAAPGKSAEPAGSASDTAGAGAGRLAEAGVTGAAGAVLGWYFSGLVHPVVGAVVAAISGINGVVSGWRGVYGWRRHGLLAFVLDSTWAAVPVAGSLLAHAVGAASSPAGYEPSLSRRQNRHVYRRGTRLKAGFAFTIGNVISGAGDVDGARRRRLITDHEDVHVWQARWFGPFYLALYGAWAIGGVVAGWVLWMKRGRTASLSSMIESCSYYVNPFEWWAYSRDAHWPPPGKVHGVGWKRPAARPLAALRRRKRQDPEPGPPSLDP